jgi:hypothetical protein
MHRSPKGLCRTSLAPKPGGKDMVSKRDIAILLIVLISGLCVTLYRAWIDPFQALAALAILIVTVFGLTVFT